MSSEKKIKLTRIDGGEGSDVSDSVAVEAPLAIYVGGR